MKPTPFSIIIPTHHRNSQLYLLLNSLAKNKYPRDLFEVIVCSDYHSEKKFAEFENLKEKINLNFTHTKNSGPTASRNKGAQLAKFEHLIFIDDDCTVKKSFLKKYNDSWNKEPNAKIIGGSVIISNEFLKDKTKLPKINRHFWCFAYLRYPSKKRLVVGDLLFTANLSYKKKFYQKKILNSKLGLPLTLLRRQTPFILNGEDTELVWRTILKKEKVIYDPSLAVQHCITADRFKWQYILKRYFFTGIEMAILDNILSQDFFYYQTYAKYTNNLFKAGKILTVFPDFYHLVRYISYAFFRLFIIPFEKPSAKARSITIRPGQR